MDYQHDPRWAALRLRTLRRDGYQCRECRRFGRIREANTAHHVWPVEDYPEYAFASWNLISLCPACHDAMHDRPTRKLTAQGERWRRSTPPPSG